MEYQGGCRGVARSAVVCWGVVGGGGVGEAEAAVAVGGVDGDAVGSVVVGGVDVRLGSAVDPVSGGGIAYYLCSIENGKFVPCPAGTPPYTFTVSTGNNGEHQFAVEAVDHAGNVSDPAKYKWKLQQPASPSVSTRLSAATVAVGTGVHDSASLSRQTGGGKHGDGDGDGDGDDRFAPGHAPAAGGTVSYTVYPSLAACLNQSGGTAEGTVTVSNGSVPDSRDVHAVEPGCLVLAGGL